MRRLIVPHLLVVPVVLLVLVFFSALPAQAAFDRWTPIGLGGGTVESLAVDPTAPGVVYAAAGVAGVYRSTDGAQSWVWRGLATTYREEWTTVVVSPVDPRRLYAGTRPTTPGEGSVYTSGDGGASWAQLFRHDVGFNSIAVSRDGTLLAAGERFEVYRSADGGATWSLVLKPGFGGGGERVRLAFDPLAPGTAYAGANTGFWRSTDGGATWQKTGVWPDGQAVDNVSALALPGTRPGFLYGILRGAIYRSADGGLTWSGGVSLAGAPDALVVDPVDPATLYAAWYNKVWISHDGGESATEITVKYPHTVVPPVTALVISTSAPVTLYAAVDGVGVAVSHGGGRWTVAEQRGLSAGGGPELGISGRLYQHYPDGAVFRSADHGATWAPLAPLPSGVAYDLAEDAGSPDRLWASTLTPALFHSADGGATWKPSTPGLAAVLVASPAPHVVLAAGFCGVRRSADDGRSWAPVLPCVVGEERGFAQRLVHRLGVVPGWPGRVWAEIESQSPTFGETTLVLWSQDSGRTWRTLNKSEGFDSALHQVAAAPGVIYLNRGGVLLRSRDEGRSWQVRGPVSDQVLTLAVDAADPDLVCVATSHLGVLRSSDGGLTWTDANTGLARLGRRTMRDLVADPSLPAVFYASPVDGGVFQIRFHGVADQ